jgi:signal recognition particle subunit SRP19
MRQQDKIIIWPAYFDVAKTRKQGRQVPKSFAVPSPKASEIREATEELGFVSELVQDVAYPKTSNLKMGMILIKKKEPKTQTISKVAKKLVQARGSATQKK